MQKPLTQSLILHCIGSEAIMSPQFRILLVLVAFLTSGSILHKIRAKKVQIQYSIFWILFSLLLIILAIFPVILVRTAQILGIGSPSNLVFLIIIFLLLVRFFNQTVEISALEVKLKELTQQIALEKEEPNNSNEHD